MVKNKLSATNCGANFPVSLTRFLLLKGNEYNYQMAVNNNEMRLKRHAQERSPFIDSLFNVSINIKSVLW